MRLSRAILVALMVCGATALAIWLLTRDEAGSVVSAANVESPPAVAVAPPEPAESPTREAAAAEGSVIPPSAMLKHIRAAPPAELRDIEITLTSAVDGGEAGFELAYELSRPPVDSGLPGTSTQLRAPSLRGAAQSPITHVGTSPGQIELSIFANQMNVGERTIDVTAGNEPLRVDMIVNAVGPIAGHVVDVDGEPVPNPRVRMRVVGADGEVRETLVSATTDRRGGFLIPVLASLPGTTIDLAAEHPAYADGEFVPIVRADRSVDRTPTLRLGAHRCEITGRVVDPAMKTERDLIVHLRATSEAQTVLTAHTAEDGRFRVLGVLPGEYALTVERRCVAQPALARIVVAASTPTIDVGDVVAVAPTLPLRVRVVDPAGGPVTNADVYVDGVLRVSLDKNGGAATSVCEDDTCDVLVVARGRAGRFPAGRLSADGTEHVLVARFDVIALRLRDRSAPDLVLPTRTARYVARRGDREIRGERVVGDEGLVIERPPSDGTWTIELDVDDFAPCTVAVDVDSSHPDANRSYDVWMLRKGD